MFERILVASLAVAAVALGAPSAHADDPKFDCAFRVVLGSGYYEVVAVGHVVHAGDVSATIRCYINVNGSQAASTSTGTGVTAGRLRFFATDSDRITSHAEVCTSHGCYTRDYEFERHPIPQEVIRVLTYVLEPVFAVLQQIDPTMCPILGWLAGTYGPITIGADGDVSMDPLGLIWDCPPYVGE